MNKIAFKPLGNRLLVRQLPLEESEKVINGIQVPESAIPLRRGIVIAVGIGEIAQLGGAIIPMETKEGDIVAFLAEAAHIPIRIGNEEYKLFRENNIEYIIE